MTTKAFTLTELLAVIVIIGILAALAVPITFNVLEKGDLTRCASNMRQLGVGFQAYAADNNGCWPPAYDQPNNAGAWMSPIWDYVYHTDYPNPAPQSKYADAVLVCPAALRKGQINFRNVLVQSYGINRSLPADNGQTTSSRSFRIQKASETCLLMDNSNAITGPSPRFEETGVPIRERHDDQYNILFCDGHVETRGINGFPWGAGTVAGNAFWIGQ